MYTQDFVSIEMKVAEQKACKNVLHENYKCAYYECTVKIGKLHLLLRAHYVCAVLGPCHSAI